MKDLSIDIETYSGIDLAKSGVYRYAESEDFRILLFGYSVDDGPVKVIDIEHGEKLPGEIVEALRSDSVLKHAFNASFERICLSRFLGMPTGRYLNPASWRCSQVLSLYFGLPASLEGVGRLLNLEEQKLEEGRSLIRKFCTPHHNTELDFPKSWKQFIEYNRRDVEVELEIRRKLGRYKVPESLWEEYALSESVNDRGIRVDMELVRNAISIDEENKANLLRRMKELTNLDNPNSVTQLKGWLDYEGVGMESLERKAVEEMLPNVPERIREVLELRLMVSKSSVKKYRSIEESVSNDGRVRGLFKFYGAHSGRFVSSRVQLQNLPRNYLPDLEEARSLVKEDRRDEFFIRYDNASDVLSQLIRTAFIPSEGRKLVVADFNAIEARVLAWLAGETWRMETFEAERDIYCESASRMFGVPVVKNGENGHLRAKGKIAELALGYGGAENALLIMGAADFGLSEEELSDIVISWREASPKIVEYWRGIDAAAIDCIRTHEQQEFRHIKFDWFRNVLYITLLSGRRLAYCKPEIGENRFGGESILYQGVQSQTKNWAQIETYGARLVENIVQATARDLLCNAMANLGDRAIVGHVHDEIICECSIDEKPWDICALMCKLPKWAKGLTLKAEGFESYYYRKD